MSSFANGLMNALFVYTLTCYHRPHLPKMTIGLICLFVFTPHFYLVFCSYFNFIWVDFALFPSQDRKIRMPKFVIFNNFSLGGTLFLENQNQREKAEKWCHEALLLELKSWWSIRVFIWMQILFLKEIERG